MRAVTATTVTLTGTGVPHPSPGRAGAGTLVRFGDLALQFDAGRGTVLRLTEAGVPVQILTATFLTAFNDNAAITYLASQVPALASPGELAGTWEAR